MNHIKRYFKLAARQAINGDSNDGRRWYRVGAVGVRGDGVIVTTNNLPTRTPHKEAHAEARLIKKLDYEAVVYVVRIDSNGWYKNSRPCLSCERKMRLRGVRRCYYTINQNEYGVINYE